MRLELGFALVQCDCGATKPAAASCTTCGSPTTEQDPYVAARSRRREQAEALSTPRDEVTPLEIGEAFSALRAWLESFSEALEGLVAESEHSADPYAPSAAAVRLGETLADLDLLNHRFEAAQKHRPSLRYWRVIGDELKALGKVRDIYLQAFVADTMEAAAEAGDEGQEQLDAAARILDYFNRFTSVTDELNTRGDDNEFAPLLEGASLVSALAGTGDLGALDKKGQELLRRIAGDDLPAVSGSGVALLHMDAAAEALFDTERLWRAARETYDALRANPQGLRGL